MFDPRVAALVNTRTDGLPGKALHGCIHGCILIQQLQRIPRSEGLLACLRGVASDWFSGDGLDRPVGRADLAWSG